MSAVQTPLRAQHAPFRHHSGLNCKNRCPPACSRIKFPAGQAICSHDTPAAAYAACGSRVKTWGGTREAASASATAAPSLRRAAASRTESSIASLTASKRCPLILGSRQPRLLLVRLGLRVHPTERAGEAAAEAERRLMTRDRRRLGSTATFRVGGELDRLRLNVVTRTGAVAPIAKISPIHAGVLLSAKLYGLLIN